MNHIWKGEQNLSKGGWRQKMILEKRQLLGDDLYKSKTELFKIWLNTTTNSKKIGFLNTELTIYLAGGFFGLVFRNNSYVFWIFLLVQKYTTTS
jgi:hypothetical protein